MDAHLGFAALRQLIRDTFRQARASGIFWTLLAVTGVCVAFCAGVSVSGDVAIGSRTEPELFLPGASPRLLVPSVVQVLAATHPLEVLTGVTAGSKVWYAFDVNPDLARREGVETLQGRLTLAFGAWTVRVGRDRADVVRYLQLLLAWGVADTLGLLLALVWTAGFVPSFLDPHVASVLLAKPVPRWQLLIGKCLGVVSFVAVQIVLLIGLTWLTLGLRTWVWDMTYLWCIPLILLHFAIFYSFSVLIAVVTRSTVACVLGSVLFWLLAWGMNYGRVMALGMPEAQALPTFTLVLVEAAYWISPKPIDGGLLLFNTLDAHQHFARPAVFVLIESGRMVSPLFSILSSLATTAGLFALSAYEFSTMDY
jgi:ABC-type transport system involved in multi-copper enzyme maturation permease subunit